MRAYALSGTKKLRGGLWHTFRRKWATERKPYPLRDVAAAGSWSDVQMLLSCYQQPDAETFRLVIEGPETGSLTDTGRIDSTKAAQPTPSRLGTSAVGRP